MSAEAIAKVIADLRAHRARWMLSPKGLRDNNGPVDPSHFVKWRQYVETVAAQPGPVIDATPIYQSLHDNPHTINLYQDHPCIAPPWEDGTVAYVNEHGNVNAVAFHVIENPRTLGKFEMDSGKTVDFTSFARDVESGRDRTQPAGWETENPVDWDRVYWIIDAFLWIGGYSNTARKAIPTNGPIFHWKFAVYEDGSPADLHWIQFIGQPGDPFDYDGTMNAHLAILGAFNFLNCRNVEIVEPKRPNPLRKRIARTGVQVSELTVMPTGKSTRSAATGPSTGIPLSSVRGHFSHYGACCPHHEPKGLLFGKYTGRCWVPQHARGDAAVGEVDQVFNLKPDQEQAS